MTTIRMSVRQDSLRSVDYDVGVCFTAYQTFPAAGHYLMSLFLARHRLHTDLLFACDCQSITADHCSAVRSSYACFAPAHAPWRVQVRAIRCTPRLSAVRLSALFTLC